MVNAINKMLSIVADATTEIEYKFEDYFDNIDIYVEIVDIDYQSCDILIKNTKLYKKVIISYHILLTDINVFYVNSDNKIYDKDFINLSDALEDIKSFLNEEE